MRPFTAPSGSSPRPSATVILPAVTWSRTASTSSGSACIAVASSRASSARGPTMASRPASRLRWSTRSRFAYSAGTRTLKRVELRQRVVANAEQHADTQIRSRDDVRQCLRERAAADPFAVVEDILLELVEDDVDLPVEEAAPLLELVGERELVRGWTGARSRRARATSAATTPPQQSVGSPLQVEQTATT